MPPAVDLVIVPKRHLKPEQLDLAAATREFLPLIKEIGGYVVLRREQNACPDISRDGTLKGPSFDQLRELSGEVCCKVIASGGIASIDDVKALMKQGLYGAICGKSLYTGTLGLGEAVRVGDEQNVG